MLNGTCAALNYNAVHELVDLLHLHHDSSFWSAVDQVMPDYAKDMKWLEHNGAGIILESDQ
nr:M48 family metallopeptidase [Neptunomonas japonica]